jgi:hypothetical protein
VCQEGYLCTDNWSIQPGLEQVPNLVPNPIRQGERASLYISRKLCPQEFNKKHFESFIYVMSSKAGTFSDLAFSHPRGNTKILDFSQ